MTHAPRRRPRRHSRLPAVDVHDLVAHDPVLARLHRAFAEAGFAPTKLRVKPRVTAKGTVSINLVWRDERTGNSMTYQAARRMDLAQMRALMAAGAAEVP
jgi:hypothetical protein